MFILLYSFPDTQQASLNACILFHISVVTIAITKLASSNNIQVVNRIMVTIGEVLSTN